MQKRSRPMSNFNKILASSGYILFNKVLFTRFRGQLIYQSGRGPLGAPILWRHCIEPWPRPPEQDSIWLKAPLGRRVCSTVHLQSRWIRCYTNIHSVNVEWKQSCGWVGGQVGGDWIKMNYCQGQEGPEYLLEFSSVQTLRKSPSRYTMFYDFVRSPTSRFVRRGTNRLLQ